VSVVTLSLSSPPKKDEKKKKKEKEKEEEEEVDILIITVFLASSFVTTSLEVCFGMILFVSGWSAPLDCTEKESRCASIFFVWI